MCPDRTAALDVYLARIIKVTTATLALIIFLLIILQVSLFFLVGLVRRRHQSPEEQARSVQPRANSNQTLPATAKDSAQPSGGWEGFREFVVERRVMEDQNHSICSFYLKPVDGQPLPDFKPGQFLTFKLEVGSPGSNELKNVVRCYSLSDQPGQDHFRVSIKRLSPPPDKPDVPPGVSSSYFHEYLVEGSRVQVKAPSGHFYLMDEPLPVVLIAGGIGITPMMSMLNTLLAGGSQREIWLFYGVRNGREQIMKKYLQTLAATYANFHLHLCYSNPDESDIQGEDFQHLGRVDIPLLRNTLKLARYQFYVCGPKAMMESIVPGLELWGVDSKDIYYESFGPASLIKHEKPKPAQSQEAVEVSFSRSGKQFIWNPHSDSLLEFAEANQIAVESGCRAGSCGSCQTALVSGEVEYSQQPDADIEPGYCLLCVSTPKGNITLDL